MSYTVTMLDADNTDVCRAEFDTRSQAMAAAKGYMEDAHRRELGMSAASFTDCRVQVVTGAGVIVFDEQIWDMLS